MKILIFGASGSGTTTLSHKIAGRTTFSHLDADDYYWKITNPPFQEKVPLVERNRLLMNDFLDTKNVIVSGSILRWGEQWITAFDLAIFIRLDDTIRMERLLEREQQRYGDKLKTDKRVKEISDAFLDWASNYENLDFDSRSLKLHKSWLKQLTCPILELDGALGLEIKTSQVLEKVNSISKNHQQ